ncbi:MAG TPA: VTT domain-containing protein [Stellaceae bacterium]|nr:VTT domain-containing protein [Stellaceae bacterium]
MNDAGNPGLRRLGRVLALALLAAGTAYVIAHRSAFDPLELAHTLAAAPAAPLLFLALHVAASLLFLPRTVLAIAAGLVFGMGWGLVWATTGSVLGAVVGFLVARYLNAGLVEPETLPRIGPILERAEAGGWRAVTALRLIPVLPHSLANYALGLTRLSLGSYALGSLLGQFPMTFASVNLGVAGSRAWTGASNWLAPTLLGFAVLLVSLLLPRLARQRS